MFFKRNPEDERLDAEISYMMKTAFRDVKASNDLNIIIEQLSDIGAFSDSQDNKLDQQHEQKSIQLHSIVSPTCILRENEV